MKTAIIYGVTGQDGSYLSELLLSKQYTVYGVARRSSLPNTTRVNHLLTQKQFHMVQGDVTDPSSIYRLLNEVQPDEVYNLAAQSHVGTSFKQPTLTWDVTAGGCLNILEAIRVSSRFNDPAAYFKRENSDGSAVEFLRDASTCGSISVTSSSTAYNTSSDYRLKLKATEKLLQISKINKATSYITGHGARNYLCHESFEKENIKINYMEYDILNYSNLKQGFTPYCTILDLIGHKGKSSSEFMRSKLIYWKDFMAKNMGNLEKK